jgi:hypothetical protein
MERQRQKERHLVAAPFATPASGSSLLGVLAAVVLAALSALSLVAGTVLGFLMHLAAAAPATASAVLVPALVLPVAVIALVIALIWWTRRRGRRTVSAGLVAAALARARAPDRS